MLTFDTGGKMNIFTTALSGVVPSGAALRKAAEAFHDAHVQAPFSPSGPCSFELRQLEPMTTLGLSVDASYMLQYAGLHAVPGGEFVAFFGVIEPGMPNWVGPFFGEFEIESAGAETILLALPNKPDKRVEGRLILTSSAPASACDLAWIQRTLKTGLAQ